MVGRHRIRPGLAALAAAITLASVPLTGTPAHAAATLGARVAESEIPDGEAFDLQLRSTGGEPDRSPDLSGLAKDFEIVATRQARRLSIVGGRRQESLDWIVTLRPRAAGELTIPSIRAGDVASAPVKIKVLAADARAQTGLVPDRSPDLFVEASVDDTKPYVQGEVRYVVRVYDGLGMRDGALADPHADGARFTSLGDERAYQKTVGERRYLVHEREYALAPQASGSLTIPPVTLEARVPEARPQGRPSSPRHDSFGDPLDDEDFFGFGGDPFARFAMGGFPSAAALMDRMMNRGRTVRVRSNPVELDVQPRPTEAKDGWFLPAHRVELTQTWSPAKPVFRVGEAVSRTVVLRALGASSEQLPRFEIPAADGVRQYPEATHDATVPDDRGTFSVLEQTVGLVPARAGTFTLPPVEVRWFDVEAKQVRTVTLPAEAIDVLPATGTQSAQNTEPAPATGAAAGPSSPPIPAPPTTSAAPPLASLWPQAGLVVPGAAAVTLLAVCAALLALRRRWAAAAPPARSGSAPATSTKQLLDDVHGACRSNDPRATRDALRRWARAAWANDPPANAAAIARRLGHGGLERAVAELEARLYGRDARPWEGAALWRELEAARRRAGLEREAGPPPVLPALYPELIESRRPKAARFSRRDPPAAAARP